MTSDPSLDDALSRRLKVFAADRHSGALSLTAEALGILKDVLDGEALPGVARRLCEAQPAMASVWNAALAALNGRERFELFERRLARAPAALVRVALDELPSPGPAVAATALSVVTYSGSGSVLRVLEALGTRGPLRVSVGEGRPHLEGRDLAARLARAGIPVDYYIDAALGQALDERAIVLVGADAIGPDSFVNKSGTHLLLAGAAQAQVPAYVVATRDKLAAPALWPLLRLPEHAPAELWADPPHGVTVRNRSFERVPSSLVTAFLTDLGPLHPPMLPDACEGQQDAAVVAAITRLAAAPR